MPSESLVLAVAKQLYRQKELPTVFHPNGFCTSLGEHESPYSAFLGFVHWKPLIN